MNDNRKKHNQHSFAYIVNKLVKSLGMFLSLARSHSPRRHSPRKRVRRRIFASVTLVIIVLTFSITTYNLVGERFNKHLTNALARITGGEIEIDDSQLNLLSDIRIKGLRVYIPDKPHNENSLIFSASDILLSYNPWSIFSAQMQVEKIVASNAMLNLVYDYDNKLWNITNLKLKTASNSNRKSIPDLTIRDSIIQYKEFRNGIFSNPVQQQFNGKLSRTPNERVIIFNFNSEEQTALPNCTISGSYDPDILELSSEMKFDLQNFAAETLPPNLENFKNLYNAINPRGQVILKSTYSKANGNLVRVIFDKASAEINWFDENAFLPLPEISGEVICSTQQTIIESVLVKFDDATFNISGSVNGYSKDSNIQLLFSSSRLKLPDNLWENFDILNSSINDTNLITSLSEQAKQSHSFAHVLKMLICAMPEKNKKIFNDLLPTGLSQVDIRFNRNQNINQVAGDINLINAGGRFHKFPYPVKSISGPIHFEPGKVAFGPMVTSFDDMKMLANGSAFKDQDNKWNITTDVIVENLIIDQRLYNAFNQKQKQLFDLFKPVGRANAHYNINVVQGQTPNDYLNIDFDNIKAKFKFFPTEINNCSGNIRWNRSQTTFDLNNARLANGNISVSGLLQNTDSSSKLDIECDFDNVNLNSELAGNLPENLKKIYDIVSPQGKLSGSASINKVLDQPIQQLSVSDIKFDDIKHNIDLVLNDGTIRYQQLPIPLVNVNSTVNITDKSLTIDQFNAEFDPGTYQNTSLPKNINIPDSISNNISISGNIQQDSFDLNLTANKLVITSEIENFCKDNFPDIWNQYQPQGITDIDLSISKRIDNILNYQCMIKPIDINATFMQYQLNNIHGNIDLANNKVIIENLYANDDKINLSANLFFDDSIKDYSISLNTTELCIDNNLKNAFKNYFKILNDDFAPSGNISSNFTASLNSDKPEINNWNINGNATLNDASIKKPLNTTNINTNLNIDITYNQENNSAIANAKSNNFDALILNRPVSNAIFDLSFNSDSKSLNVDITNAMLCGGPAEGKISAILGLDNNFTLEFTTKRAKLNQLILSDPNSPTMNGLVDGFLKIQSDNNNKKGSFNFFVSEGNLGKLPLLVAIINIINIGSSHQGAFNQAWIDGNIVDGNTIFNQIAFKGDSIEITGSGDMVGPFASENETFGDINLMFMIEAPDIIRPIPIIGSFFNAIRNAIIYVQATGKYNNPSIKPITLPVLRGLFQNNPKMVAPNYNANF